MWIAPIGRDKGQARAGCHLNRCGTPIAEQSEEGQDRLTKGAGHLLLHNLPACSIYQRLDCTLAAIGHGHDFDLRFWIDVPHTLCYGFSSLRCCEAAFERLRSNDDTHACTSVRMEEMIRLFRMSRDGNDFVTVIHVKLSYDMIA